jgi:hypothetical protein
MLIENYVNFCKLFSFPTKDFRAVKTASIFNT